MLKFPKNSSKEERKQLVMEFIKRRRRQLLIHSIIYYKLNESIISDAQWDKWAKELVKVQNKFPKTARKVELSENFKDFDAATGFNLKGLSDPNLIFKAELLIKLCKRDEQKRMKKRNKKKGVKHRG